MSEILGFLDKLKGVALDVKHIELIKSTFRLTCENNDALKESKALLVEELSRLKEQVTRLVAENAELREKHREHSEQELYKNNPCGLSFRILPDGSLHPLPLCTACKKPIAYIRKPDFIGYSCSCGYSVRERTVANLVCHHLYPSEKIAKA